MCLMLPQLVLLEVLLEHKLMGLHQVLKVPKYTIPSALLHLLLHLLLQCPWHRHLGLPKPGNMLDLLLLLLRSELCHLGCQIHRPLGLRLRKFKLLDILVHLLSQQYKKPGCPLHRPLVLPHQSNHMDTLQLQFQQAELLLGWPCQHHLVLLQQYMLLLQLSLMQHTVGPPKLNTSCFACIACWNNNQTCSRWAHRITGSNARTTSWSWPWVSLPKIHPSGTIQ